MDSDPLGLEASESENSLCDFQACCELERSMYCPVVWLLFEKPKNKVKLN